MHCASRHEHRLLEPGGLNAERLRVPLCGMSVRSWDVSAIGHFRGTDQQGNDFDIVFGPEARPQSKLCILSVKTNDECRTLPRLALDFDCSAVQLGDLLANCQAKP